MGGPVTSHHTHDVTDRTEHKGTVSQYRDHVLLFLKTFEQNATYLDVMHVHASADSPMNVSRIPCPQLSIGEA